MAKVFISYSRKDSDFARRLAGDLEKAGYDVWWDLTDLRGGDDWPRVIPAAIESSDKFIVVLSPNSAVSDWVEKEYTQALSLRKKIIPIMLKQSSIPFALNTINYIDFTGDDYAASLNNLLRVLGYTGEPVVPAPIPFSTLLRRYAIPIGIGALILLAILGRFVFTPPPPPTSTPTSLPTTPVVIITDTDTPTASPTSSSTATSTPTNIEPTNTETPTETPTPTPTSTPTLSQGFSLPICIYILDSSNANVRNGPSTDDNILGKLEPNGTKCPFFSATIVNKERQTWFQVAPNQKEKAEFQQYAGGWISGNSLAAIDLPRNLPLPICIYHPDGPVNSVEVRVLPDTNQALLENTLKADGTDCPFFDTRVNNSEGIWYRFHPNQKEKVEFQQYAGGWLHESFLVVHTLNLPAVTLTPTAIPSHTPTLTSTATPSDTPTITPTFTHTPSPTFTDTPVPTETQTPTPTETPTP